MSFEACIMADAYRKVQGLGDRLPLIKEQVDWERFRPIIASVYKDNKTTGGRPHTDELVIARCLVLQHLYGLSDEELEFSVNDRLSFRNFVGFIESVPDFTTIWWARERLKNAEADRKLWDELQHQIDEKGMTIKKGVIQDATFVEADPGRKRKSKEKQLEKEGKKPEYTEKQLAHIDHDSTYSVKNGTVHYGYKSHIKIDADENHLVRKLEVTTAAPHDSQVDLVKPGDVAAWRDKGYVGVHMCPGVVDNTMLRAVRGKKLNGGQQKRNRTLSKVRSLIEHTFAVTKRVFDGEHVFVKTLGRVRVKETLKYMAFNLYQLVSIKRKALATAS